MNNQNHLFLISFLVSSLVHVPLYTSLGHYYFGGERTLSIRPTHPSFTYIPLKRAVVITPVSRPSPQKQRTAAPQGEDVQRARKVLQQEKREPTIKQRRSWSGDYRFPKPGGSRVLLPSVENVDLRDHVVRDAFYNYYELLSAIIGRFAVYPEDARDTRTEGVVYVSFILRQSGDLGAVVLKHTSGNGLLDRSAMSAIQNAAPFPPLPLELKKEHIRLNVPISFEIE